MCSVLSHELRSPLSVMQGYIRLLQRQRDDSDPESAMLRAMLDATGRLTAIAHQASELGSWLRERDVTPLGPTTLSSVLDELDKQVAATSTVSVVRRASGDARVHADAPALARALAAVAQSMAREVGGTVEISLSAAREQDATGFSLRAVPFEESPDPPAAERPVVFDSGGAGLALIAASHIFDVHGASIDQGQGPRAVDVRLRPAGGSQ